MLSWTHYFPRMLQASLQLPELWQEAAVLQRLTYKNKNQHRASKHLQAVQQVRRGSGHSRLHLRSYV